MTYADGYLVFIINMPDYSHRPTLLRYADTYNNNEFIQRNLDIFITNLHTPLIFEKYLCVQAPYNYILLYKTCKHSGRYSLSSLHNCSTFFYQFKHCLRSLKRRLFVEYNYTYYMNELKWYYCNL